MEQTRPRERVMILGIVPAHGPSDDVRRGEGLRMITASELAGFMAAHAIHDDEQGRMLSHSGRDPVLILLAPAKEADVRVVHPQEEFRTSVRLDLALYHPAAIERSFRSRLDNHS